jgi:pyrophosphatase PpaX
VSAVPPAAATNGAVRTVLFDLDGTLVDTWALYLECFMRTLEPYLGRRLGMDELRTLHPSSEMRAFDRVVPADEIARAHATLMEHYRALHAELFGGVYPGVIPMLDALRGRGLTLGIVTGKSRAAWAITQEHSGLGPFAVFVGDDDVTEAKPSPEGLRLALRRLGVPAREALYVGDSVLDATAARDVGVRFAAALWAKRPGDVPDHLRRVREVGAWVELRQPDALVAVLEKGR